LSGIGGTTSLEIESGHAPGKDGVGEAAGMMNEKEKQRKGSDERESFWDK